MHHLAKFRDDQWNRCWDMAFFSIFFIKMAAADILDLQNLEILRVWRVKRVKVRFKIFKKIILTWNRGFTAITVHIHSRRTVEYRLQRLPQTMWELVVLWLPSKKPCYAADDHTNDNRYDHRSGNTDNDVHHEVVVDTVICWTKITTQVNVAFVKLLTRNRTPLQGSKYKNIGNFKSRLQFLLLYQSVTCQKVK